ncbi:MAG: BtpA/SgcQ family protein [Planctomycetota bacterium]
MRSLLERRERALLIGVVHLRPLPGAVGFDGDDALLLARAATDARALVEGGADALVVENFGDAPFFKEAVPPETIAGLTLGVRAVQAAAPEVPVGVNVLRNDARAALGICAATGASFLRVNVHVGAAVTDQGIVEGRAAETLRERARLAPRAVLLADVHVKHAAPLRERPIEESAAETFGRGRADALILTGEATGAPPAPAEVVAVHERVPTAPLLIGSGLTPDNAAELASVAAGAIVGTALKEGGDVFAPVDPARVRRMREALDALTR